MTVGNSEGTCRCDARCHTAAHSKCSCVCNGHYHGRGSSAAAQEELTRDWFGNEFRDEWKAVITPAERTRLTKIAEAAIGGLSLGVVDNA